MAETDQTPAERLATLKAQLLGLGYRVERRGRDEEWVIRPDGTVAVIARRTQEGGAAPEM